MYAKNNIKWFIDQFGERVEKKVDGTPLTVPFLAAIAMQETGYLWSRLRKNTNSEEELLELCVGDKLGWARGRSYFPTSKNQLLNAENGRKMYDISRDILKQLSQKIPKEFSSHYHNTDDILYGYGIFQYDILFYAEGDSKYFLNKEWTIFENCLEKAVDELLKAINALGYGGQEELTAYELALAGAVYNGGIGNFDATRGLKNGRWLKWASKYYGEIVYEYTKIGNSLMGDKPSNSKRFFVNARSGLKLRSGPGKKYSKKSLLPLGQEIFVLGYEGKNNKWARVDLQNDSIADGYVYASFLSENG